MELQTLAELSQECSSHASLAMTCSSVAPWRFETRVLMSLRRTALERWRICRAC